MKLIYHFILPLLMASALNAEETPPLVVEEGAHITIIGAGMASRMNHFGEFETELFLRYPNADLTIRNMGDEGNTPIFRPHPGQKFPQHFAVPEGHQYVREELQRLDRDNYNLKPKGKFGTPDEWLTRLETDIVIAFFGFNSAFEGPEGLERYKKELDVFLKHTLAQRYNGESAPQVVLVSPTAIQDLSDKYDVPDGVAINENLKAYTEASSEIAAANGVRFVDAFRPSLEWYQDGKEYTRDGALLNADGYTKLAPLLADAIFGAVDVDDRKREEVHAAVMEKNWAWLNDYKIPNGVHVYGRRHEPYGPDNYPFELQKAREMTALRDQAIWATLKGEAFDLAAEDAKTLDLPPVETNYRGSMKQGSKEYQYGEKALEKFILADGYQIELFASEQEFPDLANPVQMAFDNKGRLWVSTMQSYPHYRIGDPKPADKILIFEDTDNDGKADKQITFAGDLHIPIGFEISHDGVYVSQSDSLILLKDIDGDDQYDEKEIILSGFDDHDTHHAFGAFCADPSGAIYSGEGLFLYSNVESVYGTMRATNGGFNRYSPQRKKLDRVAQLMIPNPWGIAFDDYGQSFYLHTSGPSVGWMLPGSVKPRYGVELEPVDLMTTGVARPTSGFEIVSSRHFPDEVQGDMLISNTIGYRGVKQHKLMEKEAGYTMEHRLDLFESEDGNFRPVDIEFAPDGSLYVVDWHNILIGHMQHNSRDPLRDHVHGRIYRVTYPARPLVEPAKVDGASIGELLENLKLHEYRTRYRTRRELRGRDQGQVMAELQTWVEGIEDERIRLEGLWVSWGANRVDEALLKELLQSEDHRIRAAAMQVLRYTPEVEGRLDLLRTAASDPHGRVRLEALTAASRESKEFAIEVLDLVEQHPIEHGMAVPIEAVNAIKEHNWDLLINPLPKVKPPRYMKDYFHKKAYLEGAEIYSREAYCGTCHQKDGKGLPDVGFPPLAGSPWVTGSVDRLIKVSLKGLVGPIEVNGKQYPGHVPMTPFESLLNDEELAAVLTYVRNSFGNEADVVTAEEVARVRKEVAGQQGMYTPAELLEAHPIEPAEEEK